LARSVNVENVNSFGEPKIGELIVGDNLAHWLGTNQTTRHCA